MPEQRKLAAIMFTDMVGFSALTQKNESLALELLKLQNEMLRPFFPKFHGTEIKTIGDAFLVEFDSALDAVNCGIEIQKTLHEYNSTASVGKNIVIRIGVHVGDVVHRDNDVFGDGVNIASRVEPLANPGGICITEDVFRQIQNKTENEVVRLGKGNLKNIQVATAIYKIILPWEKKRFSLAEQLQFRFSKKKLQLVIAFLLLIIVAGGSWWYKNFRSQNTGEKSIAVLPFVNQSADAETEYLSNGITESIINSLSQIPSLRVIPRSTVFIYKGKQGNAEQIGNELQVQSVLTGSIVMYGDKLRVQTELIDVQKNAQLWGEQYNSTMKDIFSLQEDIAHKITDKLRLKLTGATEKKMMKRSTENTAAYELYLKGNYYIEKATASDLEKGLHYLQEAIALDSNFALAYDALAFQSVMASDFFLPPYVAMPEAIRLSEKALSLDNELSQTHALRGFIKCFYEWKFDDAEKQIKLAYELNSKDARTLFFSVWYYTSMGKFEIAIANAKRIQELEPHWVLGKVWLGFSYYFARQYDNAVIAFKKNIEEEPNFYFPYWYLGLTYVQLHKYDEAITEIQTSISLDPGNPTEIAVLGVAYAASGKRNEAEKIISSLQEKMKTQYVPPEYLALIYSAMKETDSAFVWLEKGFPNRGGIYSTMKTEPLWDNIRSDKRFKELLKKIGLEK